MELPDELYDQIESLSEAGTECSDDSDFAGAIEHCRKALALLPEPQLDWDAATWLHPSLGEAYYRAADYGMAQDALFTVLDCPAGHAHPLTHCIMGKTSVSQHGRSAPHRLIPP